MENITFVENSIQDTIKNGQLETCKIYIGNMKTWQGENNEIEIAKYSEGLKYRTNDPPISFLLLHFCKSIFNGRKGETQIKGSKF